MEVRLISFETPSIFFARDITAELDFPNFAERLNKFYRSVLAIEDTHLVDVGELCIGRVQSQQDKCFRVRVVGRVHRSSGYWFRCFKVDYGEEVLISPRFMFPIDAKFARYPFLAKRHILHGLVPTRLELRLRDVDVTCIRQPAECWDSAAIGVAKNILEQFSIGKVNIIGECDEARFVELFLRQGDEEINYGDYLVDKQFCTFSQAAADKAIAEARISKAASGGNTSGGNTTDAAQRDLSYYDQFVVGPLVDTQRDARNTGEISADPAYSDYRVQTGKAKEATVTLYTNDSNHVFSTTPPVSTNHMELKKDSLLQLNTNDTSNTINQSLPDIKVSPVHQTPGSRTQVNPYHATLAHGGSQGKQVQGRSPQNGANQNQHQRSITPQSLGRGVLRFSQRSLDRWDDFESTTNTLPCDNLSPVLVEKSASPHAGTPIHPLLGNVISPPMEKSASPRGVTPDHLPRSTGSSSARTRQLNAALADSMKSPSCETPATSKAGASLVGISHPADDFIDFDDDFCPAAGRAKGSFLDFAGRTPGPLREPSVKRTLAPCVKTTSSSTASSLIGDPDKNSSMAKHSDHCFIEGDDISAGSISANYFVANEMRSVVDEDEDDEDFCDIPDARDLLAKREEEPSKVVEKIVNRAAEVKAAVVGRRLAEMADGEIVVFGGGGGGGGSGGGTGGGDPGAKLCWETLEQTGWDRQLLRALRDSGTTKPSRLQSHAWPLAAHTNTRNLVLITEKGPPPNQPFDLIDALVLPVLTAVIECQADRLGYGPLALILCSTWDRVTRIYERAVRLLAPTQSRREVDVVGVVGVV